MLLENIILFCEWFLCGPVDGAWGICSRVLRALLFPSAAVAASLPFVCGTLQMSSCIKLMLHHASQNARVQQGMKWLCYKYVSAEKSSLMRLAQPLLTLSEAGVDGSERNPERSVARGIARCPPGCASQRAQSLISVLLPWAFGYAGQKQSCFPTLNATLFPLRPSKC